jgi:hypothetical protein
MANQKLSQLPSGSPPQSTDLVYIARSGTQYSITVGQLIAIISGTIPFSGITTGANTTAAMTVGSGAVLSATGSGQILATNLTPSINPPQRVALASPVSLPANTQTIVLSITVTFPSAAGNYRADVRYGLWGEVGPNGLAAEVIDTTNNLAFALSGQDLNGLGYVGLSASEISSHTYAAGSTAVFTLQAITNASGGGTAEVTSGLFSFSPALATYLSVTPVLTN